MAVSRHDPDWQLVMAQAAMSGVEFRQHKDRDARRGLMTQIHVVMPDHYSGEDFFASSRWSGAIAALIKLGLFEFLPDAAKNAANRPEMRAANFNRNVLRSTPHDQHDDVRHGAAEGQGSWR